MTLVELRQLLVQSTLTLSRVKKGKLLGQEIELSDALAKLDASAKSVESEVAAAASMTPPVSPQEGQSTRDEDQYIVSRIVATASKSPKLAIIELATELEREIRDLMGSTGWGADRFATVPSQVQELVRIGVLSQSAASSMQQFWVVRNLLVHGRQASADDVLAALDSGITILRAVRAIPREANVVHSLVPLYSDPKGRNEIDGVKGLILKTSSPGGIKHTLRIFPTTRNHFQSGKRVAWEWNNGKVYQRCYYRDPESGSPVLAWDGSMEFIGRTLEDSDPS